MGGVGCFDQNMCTYMIAHGSRKWEWVGVGWGGGNLLFVCRSLCQQCISNSLTPKREPKAKATWSPWPPWIPT